MSGDIINLNVGGTRYSTSRQTLTWVPETFFTSLLSGRIPSLKDETGAIFVDRDPKLFSVILNYLRTKEIDLRNVDLHALRHEAEYYGLSPLLRLLVLCEELDHPACGNVLFHNFLAPPVPPLPETPDRRQSLVSIDGDPEQPGTSRQDSPDPQQRRSLGHSRNSSLDVRFGACAQSVNDTRPRGHSHNSSLDLTSFQSSPWESQAYKNESPITGCQLNVTMVRGHHNWICVAYPHFVCCYRMKDSTGWHLVWTSKHMDSTVSNIAINAKVSNPNQDQTNKMVAATMGSVIRLWSVSDEGENRERGIFNLNVSVDSLFFIGSQLVALSQTGKVGVWHAMTQHWQIQDVAPITSHDVAGTILLLGCNNGSIYYIDMQKFPLRMKDNDLLVTELYKDPTNDSVTALSVYMTPNTSKTSLNSNWIEIAYGTSAGTVRVIVQHPETVGHGQQLFQTFTVHRSKITKVMLSEKHLVSVCSEYNHVRTWSVTRFRGMISTQPGSTSLASFKVVSLEHMNPQIGYITGNDIGPYGEQDDQQVFIQKVIPESNQLFVRLSSTGQRVCIINSVDGSTIGAFCVHECEGSNRMGSRPRRYLFTGHSNGSIQMWDLTSALDMMNKGEQAPEVGGPSHVELFKLLDQCDLGSSRSSTPCISPAPSMLMTPAFQPLTARSRSSGIFTLTTAGAEGGPQDVKLQVTKF